MLEYDWLHWATFLSAALLLNISPGPDIAFIVGQTVARGRARGFAAMFGIWTGALCHVLLAAVGLSALLAASATAFSIVKWCGVVYLVWLGIKALSSKGERFELHGSRPATAKAVFCQGLLVDLLNPKAAVFFIAFLPQFVVARRGSGVVATACAQRARHRGSRTRRAARRPGQQHAFPKAAFEPEAVKSDGPGARSGLSVPGCPARNKLALTAAAGQRPSGQRNVMTRPGATHPRNVSS